MQSLHLQNLKLSLSQLLNMSALSSSLLQSRLSEMLQNPLRTKVLRQKLSWSLQATSKEKLPLPGLTSNRRMISPPLLSKSRSQSFRKSHQSSSPVFPPLRLLTHPLMQALMHQARLLIQAFTR